MDLGLDKRSALVTGSYRGTGSAVARVLAREGVTVLVPGLEAGQADALVAELKAEGGKAFAVTGDIRNDEGAEAVAEATRAACGGVDILVNNYGTASGRGWLDGDSSDWEKMFQTNTLSGARMVRHLVPEMKERGWGRVLFLSTVGSARPRAQMPGYYASKASLANMAVSLCKELAHTGITVNTVSPGILATAEVRAGIEARAKREAWQGAGSWEAIETRAAQSFLPNPSGRLGKTEEVGQLIAFWCCEAGGTITGPDTRSDGGAADCV